MDKGARAPSEVRIGINLTTNWKSSLRRDCFDHPNIEVTINSMNVLLNLVGKLDTTINLELSLNKEFGADCAPSDLSRAALSPKMIEALHSPSECGIMLNSTIN